MSIFLISTGQQRISSLSSFRLSRERRNCANGIGFTKHHDKTNRYSSRQLVPESLHSWFNTLVWSKSRQPLSRRWQKRRKLNSEVPQLIVASERAKSDRHWGHQVCRQGIALHGGGARIRIWLACAMSGTQAFSGLPNNGRLLIARNDAAKASSGGGAGLPANQAENSQKNGFDQCRYLCIMRAFAKTAPNRGCYVRSH